VTNAVASGWCSILIDLGDGIAAAACAKSTVRSRTRCRLINS
jgi:hypothetical protein